MSLPSTISAGSSVTFDDASNINGNTVVYYAVSPQGDLTGRPTARFAQEKTKAGIQRSLQSTQWPVYNDATGAYVGFVKIDTTISRHETVPIAFVETCVGNHQVCLNDPGVTPVLINGLL